MNWSSGKDAAMALHALLQNPNLECRTLLTSISQEFQRVSMHGLPRALVEKQAQALELPIRWMELPRGDDRLWDVVVLDRITAFMES